MKIRARVLLPFVLFSILLPMLLYLVFLQTPDIHHGESLRSNLGFFLLINLNIIVVMVLGFMVIKNIVKLLLDRKRRILGSRLRARLVGAFVGLSLIPTALLFLVSKGIVESVLGEWFSPQIAASIDGAMLVAQQSYDIQETNLYRNLRYIGDDLSGLSLHLVVDDGSVEGVSGNEEAVEDSLQIVTHYLESKRQEYGLFELTLVDRAGRQLVAAQSEEALHRVVDIPGPSTVLIRRSMEQGNLVQAEQSLNGEFLRGYAQFVEFEPITTAGVLNELSVGEELVPTEAAPTARYAIVATVWIPPEVNETLAKVIASYDDYRELRTFRRPLASSYILTLVIVTLMIVFAAIWVGFYLARGLSIPIQLIAAGTQEIAQGNLEHKIPDVGDDELSILVRSFNKMTEDLRHTTGELVSRRRYMETVLASVGVGVTSVDTGFRITTLNFALAEMFGIEIEDVVGQEFKAVFPEQIFTNVEELVAKLVQSKERISTSTITVDVEDSPKQLQVTANKLLDDQGRLLGAVILFDDLTELVGAQRMAAWREVARRIAHEIKNPLTPIQLSAQRMQRRFCSDASNSFSGKLSENEKELISDATGMIISQVETLRNLVNEFSRFARMPKAVPRPTELNEIIQETVTLYREAHEDVLFEVDLDQGMPLAEVDRSQISRVLVNLIDNAVGSVRKRYDLVNNTDKERAGVTTAILRTLGIERSSQHDYLPSVTLKSTYDSEIGLITIEVVDNGVGIPEGDRAKIFEPYYSTKDSSKGATGLGLAIVNQIVADHRGYVRIRENSVGGVTIAIELPAIESEIRKTI